MKAGTLEAPKQKKNKAFTRDPKIDKKHESEQDSKGSSGSQVCKGALLLPLLGGGEC